MKALSAVRIAVWSSIQRAEEGGVAVVVVVAVVRVVVGCTVIGSDRKE